MTDYNMLLIPLGILALILGGGGLLAWLYIWWAERR